MSSASKNGQPILYLDLEAKPMTEMSTFIAIEENSTDVANTKAMTNDIQASENIDQKKKESKRDKLIKS